MTTSSDRRGTRRAARGFAIAAALAVTSLAPRDAAAQGSPAAQPSAADLESARELFKEARELRQKGDLRGALERFKAAHQYGQTPVTGLELGRTHMDLGELLEARETLLGVARIKVAADETEKSVGARAEAAELAEKLRPRIPTVVVKVTNLGPGAQPQIQIDGAALPVVSGGAIRKVDPGMHAVVVKVGAREEKREVAVAEGETKEVSLDLGGATGGPAGGTEGSASSSAATGGPSISPIVWAGLGLGAAGLGVGTVTGILALGKASEVDRACEGTRCPPSAKDTVDGGRSLATVSTVGFAVGVVGVGVAAVGWFVLSSKGTTTPKSGLRVAPVVAHDGVGLAGTF